MSAYLGATLTVSRDERLMLLSCAMDDADRMKDAPTTLAISFQTYARHLWYLSGRSSTPWTVMTFDMEFNELREVKPALE